MENLKLENGQVLKTNYSPAGCVRDGVVGVDIIT